MPSFFMDGDSCEFYSRIRREPELAHIKDRLELLYQLYHKHADKNFRGDARKHLPERYWEMLSCVALSKHNFEVKKISDKGLEFFSKVGGVGVWFEAVCATAGDERSPGYFQRIEDGVCQPFDEDRFLARVTGVLNDKLKKIREKDLTKIDDNDAIVILLNSGEAFNNWKRRLMDVNGVPFFAKALFPIGRAAAQVSMTGEPLGRIINFYRDTLQKYNGSSIATDFFSKPDADRISAVIHSMMRVQDAPEPIGDDFVIVRNENARTPLPEFAFNWCRKFSPNRDA